MDPRTPLTELVLAAESPAQDAGFVALADLSAAFSAAGLKEGRLIGGLMVTLLAHRWGAGASLYRETADADLGVHLAAAGDPALVDELLRLGYEQAGGGRLQRDLQLPGMVESAQPKATIDILVPSYRSRARRSVRVAEHLTTTEVAGLAPALARPCVQLNLAMRRLDGSLLHAEMPLPDEPSALVLKAYAWRSRMSGRDAVDLWRCLEIAYLAGVRADAFDTQPMRTACAIVREALQARNGLAMREMAAAAGLSRAGADARFTRLRALVQAVLPTT